ncbi:dentin sialophosphoprotein isoform X2 [Solenopsis invicta]|uniref:dentin sialophosphoprotein isoform X2 n=1 Tax=Solenopsis invicta TaxID=13686 RepID=UPI000E33D57D|nr:dentin sialophosphoprotein isoform X2 [Solenopsis invicta]
MSRQEIEMINTQAKLYRKKYKEWKNNSNYLTKLLSKEKQNNQALLKQNMELMEQNQYLKLVCNKRNIVISSVLNNAKKVQKMLGTITGYVTNISMCQKELNASNAVNLSSTSIENKSPNRISTKLPAKNVVKPMVNEHTKPMINLTQVNIENINNVSKPSKLSDIKQEITTPTRSPKINETRSPITSLFSTPLNNENDVMNKQTLKRKGENTHQKQLSVSDNAETPSSAKHVKVVQYNKIINVAKEESDNNVPHDLSDKIKVKSQSDNKENKTHADASKKDNVDINNKVSNKDFSWNASMTKKSKLLQNNTQKEEKGSQEDPKSLLNNIVPSQDELEKLDSNVMKSNKEISKATDTLSSEKDAASIADGYESNSYHKAEISIGDQLPAATASNYKRSLDGEDVAVKKKNEKNRTQSLPATLITSSPQDNATDKQELKRKRIRCFSRRLSLSLLPLRKRLRETSSSVEHIEVIDIENDDDTPHELSERINAESQSVNEENKMHAEREEKGPQEGPKLFNKTTPSQEYTEESPKSFNKTMPSQNNEPEKLESNVIKGNKEISKATDMPLSKQNAAPIADGSGSDSNSSCHKADINIGKLLSIAIAANRERSSNSEDSVIQIESDTELMIPKDTNINVPNQSSNESDYCNTMVKLPLNLFNEFKRTSIPYKAKHSSESVKELNTKVQVSFAGNSSTISAVEPRNTQENNRDLSVVKVESKELDESHVKPRTSSNDTSTNNLTFIKDGEDEEKIISRRLTVKQSKNHKYKYTHARSRTLKHIV